MFFTWVRSLVRRKPSVRSYRPRPSVPPRLEFLEDRCVPAGSVFTWNALVAGNWSLAANWKVNGLPAVVAPANGDSVVFDNTANTASTDDITGLKLANLTVGNAYTSTITLIKDLEVDGNVTIQAGTLASNGSELHVPNAASVFTWGGGTIDTNAIVQLGTPTTVPTLTINGGAVTLNGKFDSYATATMTSTGDITMGVGAAFTNDVGATFNIQVDHGFIAPNIGPTISNGGLFEKTGGDNTSTIGAVFSNIIGGTLLAAHGKLAFTDVFRQTGGTTQMYGGAIGSAKIFNLSGGVLEGVGTFTGSVNETNGIVIPGYGSLGGGGPSGTLTITGDYTEGAQGQLVINTDASSVSQLHVQGTVDVQGLLFVNRDPEFQPSLGATFAFLTWGAINPNHDFSSETFTNNTWGANLFFAAVRGNAIKQYQLVVQ